VAFGSKHYLLHCAVCQSRSESHQYTITPNEHVLIKREIPPAPSRPFPSPSLSDHYKNNAIKPATPAAAPKPKAAVLDASLPVGVDDAVSLALDAESEVMVAMPLLDEEDEDEVLFLSLACCFIELMKLAQVRAAPVAESVITTLLSPKKASESFSVDRYLSMKLDITD